MESYTGRPQITKERVFEELNIPSKLDEDSVWGLLCTIKDHDSYSFEHSIRVALMVGAVAGLFGVNENEIPWITVNALLHDIGKERISREILDKPGPLTASEQEFVAKHSAEGLDMITEVFPSYKQKFGLVAQHHDYPGSNPKNEVNDSLLILQLCDYLDSLLSNRPYSEAMDLDDALNVMMEKFPNKIINKLREHKSAIQQTIDKAKSIAPDTTTSQ